jgi:ATP-dependent Clp protease ATP-binding subunit ClpC
MSDRFDRFTDGAKQALMGAQRAAQRLSHTHIGTEHLLLGLVAEGQGIAAGLLTSLGVGPAAVRAAVRRRHDASAP